MANFLNQAIADVRAGFRMRRVWFALATEDIGDQHRRTTIGPAWLLFNYLAFAGVFIFVFQRGAGIPSYETYIAVGLFVWLYMSDVISGSISLFVREEGLIKGTKLPLSVYVMRMVSQSVIRATYAFLGCALILMMSGAVPSSAWILSALALLLIVVIAPAVIILFAFLGAFFPDSQFIVTNLMRIGMFITPVFWAPGTGDSIRHVIYAWNPFTYFLEIVRLPILTGEFPLFAFVFCSVVGVLCWIFALVILGSFGKKVVFYL